MQHLLKTAELLMSVAALKAEEAYEKIKPHISMYLKAVVITTLSWLFLILLSAVLKAVTGMIFFGYLFAFTALAISLLLGLMWAPIGMAIGMLVEKTANPIDGGKKYIRFFAIAVFIELFVSMYIIRVPMHQNISSVPILIGSALAVAIGSAIWGGFLSGRFYTFIAMVIMSLTTLSFFFPETFQAVSKKFDGLDSAIAKAIREPHTSIQKPDQIASQARQTRKSEQTVASELERDNTISYEVVVEISPNKWSNEIRLTPGAKFRIKAPEGKLKFLFRNGYVVSINNRNDEDVELNNIPDVVFRMSGPTGIAKIIIYKKSYELSRQAEKTQPVAQKNNEQAIRWNQALADAVRKARADSLKLALEIEKSPQYIKAKMDSARAAQESLCVALEKQYKYK